MNTTPWPARACALILTLGASGSSVAADAVDPTRAVADCREEGLAEGLDGAALDEFVADCVRALQQVEIRNLER